MMNDCIYAISVFYFTDVLLLPFILWVTFTGCILWGPSQFFVPELIVLGVMWSKLQVQIETHKHRRTATLCPTSFIGNIV